MGKKEQELAAQRELKEAAERHWQVARSLAHDLVEGELQDTGKVWGVVLEEGERFLSDVQGDYARYFGTQAAYTHVNGLFLGPVPFVALGLVATAVVNASRRSAAEAAARTQWREHQRVRVIVTDRRLLCQLADGRWLSFYYRGATALYPEPAVWSLVMDFPDTTPLRLGGMASPIACVAAVWAVYGVDGLRDHPGLEPLRNWLSMAPRPYSGPEYTRLLAAARRSLERTGGGLTGSVSVKKPDDDERKAIIGITGQYRPEGVAQITVRLADLDAAVRERTGNGLADYLAASGPPLRNRPAEREKLESARDAIVRSGEESFLMAEPWYAAWLAETARDGTITKLAKAGEAARFGQAVRVLEAVAGRDGPVLLQTLAAEVTGDTHALDHGSTLSTLTLRGLAARLGAERPATAEDRREVWDGCGVIVDDLASRVLVLNLQASGQGLGEWLSGAALLGTPFYVTLQQLEALPVTVSAPVVYVCENPAVLRRASRELGAASLPLVCTEGRPSTAFHQLAAAVTGGGGQLRYHGDFDWPGVAIAGSVIARHGAVPWRFSAADYLAGVRAEGDYVPLSGPDRPTPWDPDLGQVMTRTGRAVYEESVADALIADIVFPARITASPDTQTGTL